MSTADKNDSERFIRFFRGKEDSSRRTSDGIAGTDATRGVDFHVLFIDFAGLLVFSSCGLGLFAGVTSCSQTDGARYGTEIPTLLILTIILGKVEVDRLSIMQACIVNMYKEAKVLPGMFGLGFALVRLPAK